jgi:hypothetical protein
MNYGSTPDGFTPIPRSQARSGVLTLEQRRSRRRKVELLLRILERWLGPFDLTVSLISSISVGCPISATARLGQFFQERSRIIDGAPARGLPA